ncbi:transposase [Pseudomonas shirazensis]|uniref:transposase n=1 Tax=Pseudomonas shirazensis TaxID=2745494 RepID=UPI003985B80F
MQRRDFYTKFFKIQVVQECEMPGVSVAAIAMMNGISAKVIRRWTRTSSRPPYPGA